MRSIKSSFIWFKERWWIVLLFVSILISVVFKRRKHPVSETVSEVKAIQAEAEVRKAETILGTERAKEIVHDKYRAEIEALDVDQKEQADELKDDPQKLARFLVRAATSNRK